MNARSVTACAAVILAGCTNYVADVKQPEFQAYAPVVITSYQAGENYVRLTKAKFHAQVLNLEAQENLWRGGLIGGGITALVGIVGKFPETALTGGAIAGGSYVYGQTLGPDVLREIYLQGELALTCVLSAGSRLHSPFETIEALVANVEGAAKELRKELDDLSQAMKDGRVEEASVITGLIALERLNLAEADRAVDVWRRGAGKIIGDAMRNRTDTIAAQLNLLIKNNEATLSSLYNAAAVTRQMGTQLFEAKHDDANTKEDTTKFMGGQTVKTAGDATQHIDRIKAASARLNDAEAAVNERLKASPGFSLDLGEIEKCNITYVDSPLLVFEPADLTITQESSAFIIIKGGRPPYFWSQVGAQDSGLVITPGSFGAASGVLNINASEAKVKPEGYDYAFSSMHPQASPQIVKIKVVNKPSSAGQ